MSRVQEVALVNHVPHPLAVVHVTLTSLYAGEWNVTLTPLHTGLANITQASLSEVSRTLYLLIGI